jgi:hypothetical protein
LIGEEHVVHLPEFSLCRGGESGLVREDSMYVGRRWSMLKDQAHVLALADKTR